MMWGRGDFCGWRPDALSPLSVRSGDPDRSRPRVPRRSWALQCQVPQRRDAPRPTNRRSRIPPPSLHADDAHAPRRRSPSCKPDIVTHEQALAAIRAILEVAAGPVSIAAVDDHGEVVACLAMDGAARDTLENARRKAYTAARSDATSTRALAEKVHASPTELASFDPAFSFFHGGVAAFSADRRVGAVGVSGLPGAEDERLAVAAIAAAGLESRI